MTIYAEIRNEIIVWVSTSKQDWQDHQRLGGNAEPYVLAEREAKDKRIKELEAKCNQRRDNLKQARGILYERIKRITELEAQLKHHREMERVWKENAEALAEIANAAEAENERLRAALLRIKSSAYMGRSHLCGLAEEALAAVPEA